VGGGINIGRASCYTANQRILRAIIPAYGVNFDDKTPASRSRLDLINSKTCHRSLMDIFDFGSHFLRKGIAAITQSRSKRKIETSALPSPLYRECSNIYFVCCAFNCDYNALLKTICEEVSEVLRGLW
jgi:hypothetical protein